MCERLNEFAPCLPSARVLSNEFLGGEFTKIANFKQKLQNVCRKHILSSYSHWNRIVRALPTQRRKRSIPHCQSKQFGFLTLNSLNVPCTNKIPWRNYWQKLFSESCEQQLNLRKWHVFRQEKMRWLTIQPPITITVHSLYNGPTD